MKVLFVGGTGLISTASVELAAERGHEVFLLNRGQHAADLPAGAQSIHADIRDVDQTRAALSGRNFDVVVDFIAFDPAHIETAIDLFAKTAGQYVFISSASAYEKPVRNYLITESTPLINPFWDYSRKKIACEARLMQEHRDRKFPVTIVRPSLTFGQTMIPHAVGSWTKPWTVADRMLKGRPILVHGDGLSLWVTTHNTDFAKGLVGLFGNPAALGEAFHITTDEVLTWDQIYRTVGEALGVEPKLVHVATDTIIRHRPEEMGSLLGDKSNSVVFDNSKIKQFVPDYAATVAFKEGVRRSVEWFRADSSRQAIDEAANQWIDAVIEAER